MLPLIGTFILSIAGHLVGKSISQAWEAQKAAAVQPPRTAPGSAAPFDAVLKTEAQRYAQGPGATATDAPTGGTALPPATADFVPAAGAGFALDDVQHQ